MTKRQIDIDDDLLDQVRTILGTKTIKDTVNSALAEILRWEADAAEVHRWLDDPDRDLRELETLKQKWRQELESLSTRARSSAGT
jgi:Arc/MetJ family transcription regulator